MCHNVLYIFKSEPVLGLDCLILAPAPSDKAEPVGFRSKIMKSSIIPYLDKDKKKTRMTEDS